MKYHRNSNPSCVRPPTPREAADGICCACCHHFEPRFLAPIPPPHRWCALRTTGCAPLCYQERAEVAGLPSEFAAASGFHTAAAESAPQLLPSYHPGG
jgi:hypothetical protein